MFIQVTHGKLGGPIGVHVDDTIEAEDEEFIEKPKLTKILFESKQKVYDNITYAGIHIETQGKTFFLHQSLFAEKLKFL